MGDATLQIGASDVCAKQHGDYHRCPEEVDTLLNAQDDGSLLNLHQGKGVGPSHQPGHHGLEIVSVEVIQ
jgi:hypothetical protein